jgi:hypothetical protein
MEVRAALAELVRREVLSVSAGPLSPERGSYGFTQDMLRRVAYDTWSRRDRKTRHLAVAAHLRAASPATGRSPVVRRRGRVSWLSVKGQGDSCLVASSTRRFSFASSALISSTVLSGNVASMSKPSSRSRNAWA